MVCQIRPIEHERTRARSLPDPGEGHSVQPGSHTIYLCAKWPMFETRPIGEPSVAASSD